MVAGLPLLRRAVLAADRAGFDQVLVGRVAARDEALLAGTSAAPLVESAIPSGLPRRIVLVADNVVPRSGWLDRLYRMPLEPDRLYVGDGPVAVIEVKDPERVVAVAAREGTAEATVAALGELFETARGALDGDRPFVLRSLGDVLAAETWLLRSLIKPSEGFMSRHVERRISLAITRRLVRTGITPNAITLISVAIGLGAAPFFLSTSPGWQLAGALAFLGHSILDGCDGELARLKYLESPHGAVLDFWGDNLVHAAVFSGMAVGWSLAVGAAWPLFLGAVAVLSTAGAAFTVYRRGVIAQAPGEDASRSFRLVEALAHRDFIYLIVLLAALGKGPWFVVFSAIGTPIFLLLLLWTGRRSTSPAAR